MMPPILKYRKTAFGKWIAGHGVKKLARELDIDNSAVFHWLSGAAEPKPENARKMVELSEGDLTLDQIYGHREHLKNSK